MSAEDLDPVTALAERRILEAMEAGAFDDQRAAAYRRWRLLQARLTVGRVRGNAAIEQAYLDSILNKLGDDRTGNDSPGHERNGDERP